MNCARVRYETKFKIDRARMRNEMIQQKLVFSNENVLERFLSFATLSE